MVHYAHECSDAEPMAGTDRRLSARVDSGIPYRYGTTQGISRLIGCHHDRMRWSVRRQPCSRKRYLPLQIGDPDSLNCQIDHWQVSAP